MPVVGTETLASREVEIHANRFGRWSIKPVGDESTTLGFGDTLEAAKDEARRKLAKAKVKVSVPFYNIDGRHGIAYGIHAGNGDALVRYDDGETDRIKYSNSRDLLKDSTPPDVLTRIAEIDKLDDTMKRERYRLMQEHAIDLKVAVQRAIEATQGDSSE